MQEPVKGDRSVTHIAEIHAYPDPAGSFVGRQSELDVLWKQLESAAAGRISVAMVAGEPGIGKTRLLAEVATRARVAGSRVLRGGASDAEGMPPYLPFLEALGHHIMTAPLDELRRQTEAVGPVLAPTLPDLT